MSINQNLKAVYECSPSQVSTFEDCNRKWAWEWLDGLRGPKHPSAEFGIGVHRHLELWLKRRVPPAGNREARVAQIMLPHLPPPHLIDPANVERDAGITLDGVHFIMALDLWMPTFRPPVVYDHKSTSSFDWALAPGGMSRDVQATMYGAWAMTASGVDEVEVQWTYGLTRGAPDALPVRALLRRGEITDRLARSVESAREMERLLAAGGRAIDVPYDPTACEKYGGCPFRDKCNLDPAERLTSIIRQQFANKKQGDSMSNNEQPRSTEDYLAKLRAKKAGNGATVNPPPAAQPTPAPAAPSAATAAAPAANDKLAQLRARKAAAASPAPVPEPPLVPAASPPVAPAEAAPSAPADAAEAPRRGRGRPAGSRSNPAAEPAPTPPPRSETWTLFMNKAVEEYLRRSEELSAEDLENGEVQRGVAEVAAKFADAMLDQYRERFGG
jgi:hypothetical protein